MSEGLGLSLREIAAAVGGSVEGDADVRVTAAAGLEDAGPGTIVRVEHPRYLDAALRSPAAAMVVGPDIGAVDKPCIRVARPRLAFARCLALLAPAEEAPPGIHPTAILAPDARIGVACAIGPYAVVGSRARIGDRCILHAHVVVGEGVEVGEDSVLFPHVVLWARTVVGRRVRIHSGAVLGADGYGYEWDGERHVKIPQIGRVRVGDDVEIGANTTVDRGTTGETIIGDGTKIDNQVQIAHNVRTGAHCLIVAQVGIAGSATLGNGVVLAGKAGVKDHVTLGDGLQVAGMSGVWDDQPGGRQISGCPARDHYEQMRVQVALHRFPVLLRRLKRLEERLSRAFGEEPQSGDVPDA